MLGMWTAISAINIKGRGKCHPGYLCPGLARCDNQWSQNDGGLIPCLGRRGRLIGHLMECTHVLFFLQYPTAFVHQLAYCSALIPAQIYNSAGYARYEHAIS